MSDCVISIENRDRRRGRSRIAHSGGQHANRHPVQDGRASGRCSNAGFRCEPHLLCFMHRSCSAQPTGAGKRRSPRPFDLRSRASRASSKESPRFAKARASWRCIRLTARNSSGQVRFVKGEFLRPAQAAPATQTLGFTALRPQPVPRPVGVPVGSWLEVAGRVVGREVRADRVLVQLDA